MASTSPVFHKHKNQVLTGPFLVWDELVGHLYTDAARAQGEYKGQPTRQALIRVCITIFLCSNSDIEEESCPRFTT